MKKIFFLAILLTVGSVSADILHIQCKVYRLPVEAQFTDSEKIPYQDIVSGDFTLDTEKVFATPDFLDLIRQHDEISFQLSKREETRYCSAAGMKKSSLFGEPGGTRLQIAAFQCGSPSKLFVPRGNSSQPSPSTELTYALVLMQKIIINGLPVLDEMTEEKRTWNLLFNEWGTDVPGVVQAPSPEDLLLEQEPIHLPEGSFRFVASSCEIDRTIDIEDIPSDARGIDVPSDENRRINVPADTSRVEGEKK